MKGLLTENGELQIVENDFFITRDVEALKCELFNFLNIRAAHIVNDVIISKGECIEDMELGLDHDLIFESDVELTKAYISRQILTYFSDRITSLLSVTGSFDLKSRSLFINFEAQTIFKENIKMGVVI
jgi:hypothetical protein